MLRTLLVRTAIVTATVAAVAGFGTPVMAETIEGEITHVELHDTPRHIKVRTGGEEKQVTISNRTSVDFAAADRGYFSEELSSLKSGMNVRVSFDAEQPARRVSVLSVPGDQRREAILEFERSGRGASLGGDESELKVRLLDVNRSRGTFRADVAGQPRTFRADDPKVLARFGEGDLVVLTVNRDDDQRVVDIRSAATVGRIVDVDRTAGIIRVDVDGREKTYKVDRLKAIRLSEGDRIRFESEERANGDNVITELDKVTGVQKVN